jgi:Flp pilus assembly protein TadG
MFALRGSVLLTGYRRVRAGSGGSSLVEAALILPILVLMMVAAIDFGRAYSLAIEVSSAAHAGALYGAQNPSDTAGMVAAARLDVPGLTLSSANAIYGCECHDGSSAVSGCLTPPTCAENYVNYVKVTTSFSYTPLLIYPGIPNPIVLQGSAEMRSGGD